MKYYKTKEELDLLTEEEIMEKVRKQILINSTNWDKKDSTDKRYIKELETYCEIRFVETSLGYADRMLELLEISPGKPYANLVGGGRREGFRRFFINGKLDGLGELQYIKGLNKIEI